MGYTALLLAAGAGPAARGAATGAGPDMKIVELMVQHSADVNAQVTGTKLYSYSVSRDAGNNNGIHEGDTALHEAARSARTEFVKYLLEHGANPNVADANGKKPIDVVGVLRVVRSFGAAPVNPADEALAAAVRDVQPTRLPSPRSAGCSKRPLLRSNLSLLFKSCRVANERVRWDGGPPS